MANSPKQKRPGQPAAQTRTRKRFLSLSRARPCVFVCCWCVAFVFLRVVLFRLVRSSFVFVFVFVFVSCLWCVCLFVLLCCVCVCVRVRASSSFLWRAPCSFLFACCVVAFCSLSSRFRPDTRERTSTTRTTTTNTRAQKHTHTHTHRTHREAGNQKRGDEERAACVRQCPRAPLTHCLGKLGSMPGRGGHHIPPPARPASTRNKRAHRNTNTPPTHKRTPHAVLVCCCCWWLPCLRVVARCSLCCVRFLFCRCWCVVVVGRVCLLACASCCWRAFLPRTRTPAGRRDTHNTHKHESC